MNQIMLQILGMFVGIGAGLLGFRKAKGANTPVDKTDENIDKLF